MTREKRENCCSRVSGSSVVGPKGGGDRPKGGGGHVVCPECDLVVGSMMWYRDSTWGK